MNEAEAADGDNGCKINSDGNRTKIFSSLGQSVTSVLSRRGRCGVKIVSRVIIILYI